MTYHPTPINNGDGRSTQVRIAIGIVLAIVVLIVLAVINSVNTKSDAITPPSYTPVVQQQQPRYVPQRPATQTVCTQDYTPYGVPVANGVHCQAVPVFGG